MNLLYVALTRAKSQLYIIHDYERSKQMICSLLYDINKIEYTTNNPKFIE